MQILIAEDDFTSRLLLQELLKPYGTVHAAANGDEAMVALKASLDSGNLYQLVCLDIMMPGLDGQEVLAKYRKLEEEYGIPNRKAAKILMTTALNDVKNVGRAFQNMCDGYLTKPVQKEKLVKELQNQMLIS